MTAPAVPRSLQDIAETLGLPVVLKLVARFGGTEIKFPKHPDDQHAVIVALGKEDGRALCNFLSGGTIYVPHMRKRGSIRADVLALESAGKDRAEIARLLGVSQRWVRAMANKTSNTDQMKLFPD
ncbi:helix-turn-helix domain-containing protein [Pararhizobium gei]|uniref:helix-turn-helix domain-containing protein n=1 Tax=Pararhizobium gei TaxID=1395951 RepID=UPI0023DA62CA|nr:helix-turn-helix domain-containing protein [Rhizobium gei]